MSFASSRGKRALTRTRVSVATALVLYGASALAAPSLLSEHAKHDHVLLPAGIYTGDEPGLRLVQDYGSLQLWQVDASHRIELNAVARDAAQLQGKAIQFESGDFDPAQPSPIPSAFGVGKGDGPRIHIVQLNGPVTDELMANIVGSGARVVASLSGNAYAVLADSVAVGKIVQSAGGSPLMRAVTAMPSFYKLSGRLDARARVGLSPGAEIDITVQIAKHGGSAASKAAIQALHRGTDALVWDNRLTLESLRLRVTETDLVTIANLDDVFAVEPFLPRRKYDEVQAQIVAGNFDGTRAGPAAPGYRAWLAARAFPTTPASYPIVDVVDDGLGTGNAANAGGDLTFRELGVAASASRLATIQNCTGDATGDGGGGHGHLNTNIVGGYDPRGDAGGIQGPFEDQQGYLRGEGINPYARLAHTKIFNNASGYSITNCGGTDANLIRSSQDRGALITSNSWGAGVFGDYDDSSVAFDIGTRDADLIEAGHQQMIMIFAAGNDGPGASSTGSPGTGKNIITVGASENDRPGPDETGVWNDGCGVGASGANNAMDVIDFSSRGPVAGGRVKPEVIAPGTHVQGTASTSPGFNGNGVCDQFRPTNQTVYASSSGTSHSTPAVAGVASLMYYWMQTEHSIAAPSPAAMKAYMMAHPTYLTGLDANDTLPSNDQGFGMPNLGAAFDTTTATVVVDQSQVFAGTGETFVLAGGIADPAKPVRIALAWTDAPGAINDATPQRNNLNLTATVNGISYTGNRFTGQSSTAGGGAADTANNYEAIFLPAGTTGPVVITVTGGAVTADGIPGNADVSDQDFALVASNFAQTPDFFVSTDVSVVQTCAVDDATVNVQVGEFNGYDGTVALSLEGEPAQMTFSLTPASGITPYASVLDLDTLATLPSGNYPMSVQGDDGTNVHSANVLLQHSAAAAGSTSLVIPFNGATNVSPQPTFAWNAAPGALNYTIEVDDDPAFASINYTATVATTSHTPPTSLGGGATLNWRVRANNNCGPGVNSAVFTFSTAPVFCVTPNVAIPDGVPAGVTSTLNIANPLVLTDVNLAFRATHTWAGDLILRLRHVETATEIVIFDRPGRTTTGFGCDGDNPNIILDDEAATAAETSCVTGANAYPPGGSFQPNNPLTGFDGQSLTGTWTLNVSDNAAVDTGSLNEWCLQPNGLAGSGSVVATDNAFAANEDTLATIAAPGVLAGDTGSGTLIAVLENAPSNGTLVGGLAQDGSFAYQPAGNFCGPDTFTYIASNGSQSDTATVTMNVACTNDAPIANADAYVATEDQALPIAAPGVLGNDSDPENSPLTATNVTQPANATVVALASGAFTFTPDPAFCSPTAETFTYTAFDGTVASAPATVSVTVGCVDDAPIADADAYGATEDTALVVSAANGLLNGDTDEENDPLTVTNVSQPANGSVMVATDGSFTYTPDDDYCSVTPDTFTYTANDGNSDSATATASITVACVNDLPTFTAAPYTFAIDEESANGTVVGSVAATDVESGVGYTITAGNTGGAFAIDAMTGQITVASSAAVSLANQPFTLTVTATDAATGTATAQVTINVNDVNNAPVADVIADAQATATIAYSLDVSDAFTDEDGDTLVFSATGLPASLTIDPATGIISGTATVAQIASYNVTVTATDAGTLSDSATFTLNVVPVAILQNGFEGN